MVETWVFIRPDALRDLMKEPSARDKYYYEHHKRRYEARYGRPQFTSSLGVVHGVNFIGG